MALATNGAESEPLEAAPTNNGAETAGTKLAGT